MTTGGTFSALLWPLSAIVEVGSGTGGGNRSPGRFPPTAYLRGAKGPLRSTEEDQCPDH
jgi:hypothetical protein